jgi:ATP-dependent exoDNAse (exonuclease V) alpha subunit
MKDLKFTKDWKQALDIMELTSESMFLTGKAGTGKSTLLRLFLDKSKKNVVVLAPTGVAALNVKGETIHSFFGFKPGVNDEMIEKVAKKTSKDKKKLIQKVDMIVIDEVSMLRADLLDYIDKTLRLIRGSWDPFGGIQMVFVGDLYQLPPVVGKNEEGIFNSRYSSPYFFSANVLNSLEYSKVELRTIHRQEEEDFVKILNGVREKYVGEEDLEYLNERVEEIDLEEDGMVYLATTNKKVDLINGARLAELYGENYEFETKLNGKVDKSIQRSIDDTLNLKEGAQVMFLNNDPAGRWVNGSIGRVETINEFEMSLKVRLVDDRKLVTVKRHTWDVLKYGLGGDGDVESKSVASMEQFPLKLAWAITIHKAQGKTFENVVVDMGWGSFAHGQTYVALSRCRSLQALRLARPIKMTDIIMDERVRNWMRG